MVAIGQKLLLFKQALQERIGERQGQDAFALWLKSGEFGGSRHFGEVAMKIADWHERLPKSLRRLVVTKCQAWNLSWLQVLCRKTSYELENFLSQVEQLEQRDGKITADRLKTLATFKKYLVLEQLASDEDWDLIALKYGLDSEQLNALKTEAKCHAEIDPYTGEREITTNSIVEALKSFNLDPTLVLAKPRAKRYSQNEVAQIRQELEAQLADKFEKIRAESEARSRQHLAEEIALKEAQMQQTLSAKDKQIEAVVNQKAQLEKENSLLRQQLAQMQSVQPIVQTSQSQRNDAESAEIPGEIESARVDINGSERTTFYNSASKTSELSSGAPVEIREDSRENFLEVPANKTTQVVPASQILNKSYFPTNLVGNYHLHSPFSNVAPKNLSTERQNQKRKLQNSASTKGRGFGRK